MDEMHDTITQLHHVPCRSALHGDEQGPRGEAQTIVVVRFGLLEPVAADLRLGHKSVRAEVPESQAPSGLSAWAALRTAHASVGSEPLSSIMVQYS